MDAPTMIVIRVLVSTTSRSVVWVTPVADATIYIDFDGDGNVDNTVSMTALQSIKIVDETMFYSGAENDEDMSGALIYAKDSSGNPVDIAVAWGQDPERSGSGDSGALDLGTTVPPLPVLTADKTSSLFDDNDGDGEISPGDVLEYTITILNSGRVNLPVSTYTIVDFATPLFDDTTYVAGSTTYTDNADEVSETTTTVPDDTSGTPFPLDEDGILNSAPIDKGERQLYKFRVVN